MLIIGISIPCVSSEPVYSRNRIGKESSDCFVQATGDAGAEKISMGAKVLYSQENGQTILEIEET